MNNDGIAFNNVSVTYPDNKPVLKNISLEIEKGSFLGIAGVNGSGKTTLTYLINGLIPHEIQVRLEGSVLVDGISTRSKPVSYFSKKVGLVFQNPDFMLFNLSVADEIGFGLKNLNLNKADVRIRKALKQVGMEGYENTDPQTLSFGQKQKICLACILAADPDYIVLDEVTAMLDYKSSNSLYRILTELNRAGKTIVIVEHDTDLLKQFVSQVVIIDGGKIILDGKPYEVFSCTGLLKKTGLKIPR